MRSLAIVGVVMAVTFAASACARPSESAADPRTRVYYIAADEVTWDYAPSGVNRIRGEPLGAAEAFWIAPGPHKMGKVYKKAVYREYTDASFTTLKPRPPEWEHLGILGPLIRAEVGDTIRVVFKNNAAFPASMHPHGVFYNKDSEGAPYGDGTGAADKADDGVAPGKTHTYTWQVSERAGPGPGDPSSVFWMYHSHVEEVKDVNAGLMGPMLVTGRGRARPDGSPNDVDREFVVAFDEVFENESWYLAENLQRYAEDPKGVQMAKDPFGQPIIAGKPGELGYYHLMESLNGFIYGNLPGLTMTAGERVRWYLMGTTNFEVHAPHWHGHSVVINHMRTDVAQLLTMGMLMADMVPDNPGTWLFHCHVGPHMAGGMQALYTVQPRRAAGTQD